MPKYVAIINTPGRLPESEPAEFDTAREAWRYLADERQRDENGAEGWPVGNPDSYTETYNTLSLFASGIINETQWSMNPDGTGTVYGATPGYEGSHDLGVAYSVQLAEAGEDNGAPVGEHADG